MKKASLDILSDESLDVFLNGMRKFDASFCGLMASGNDFTLRLEVHGNRGKLLHCRCYQDDIERPRESGGNEK